MDSVLIEFPAEKRSFRVRPFRTPAALAILRERSKRGGRIDQDLLMVRTLEMAVVEPRLSYEDVLALMKELPDVAASLAVRIIELTTG